MPEGSCICQDDSVEKVVLVNNKNKQLGLMDKLLAHKCGALHRAFSVFIFSSKNELLLQRRSLNKYHSPGQWANTCCGHPRENEDTKKAAGRRLVEEMGISTALTHVFEFVYKADLLNDLVEHEYLHLFTGVVDHEPRPNISEVSEYLWVTQAQLKGLNLDFAPWFRLYMQNYEYLIDAMFKKGELSAK